MQRIERAEAQARGTMDRAVATLQTIRHFSEIDTSLLGKLLRLGTFVALERGELLIREGDTSAFELYVLIEGALVVESESDFILRVNQPGDIVGEIALLQGSPRTADVIAEVDALVVAIKQETMMQPQFAELAPVFNMLLTRSMANKLRATTSQLFRQRGIVANPPVERPKAADTDGDTQIVRGILEKEWPQLTSRELEVLQLFGRGYNYEDVGQALKLSINTVGTHVRHIYRKLEVRSKSEAILEAIELGIVPDPGSRRR